MTEDEKTLLVLDLSPRLAYKCYVMVQGHDTPVLMTSISGELINDEYPLEICKPLLRSLHDLTKEERKQYYASQFKDIDIVKDWVNDVNTDTIPRNVLVPHYNSIDYLYSIEMDFRGLIAKGLAIKVTTENNPY